ncbi:hypothetical protein HN51_014681 [Arachis hypogaea]|uniref:C2H2-type domain-containing protein n=1 Tax=Arachis hypogaea TaxID=3818 RepID=A0A445CNH3_ARAHY|nr:zinc finger protein GAI-ASSOCIATED FACTOR 1 [Arachis hypogaea]QHO45338.1 Protein indeterminate-domain [Arachis hypogaea]RYR52476.1 hypothetical protein Ahy_A06g027388 [Arachis hypogaea]
MSNITSCDSGSFSTDNTNSRVEGGGGDASLLLLNKNKQQSESEILGGGGGGNFHSPNSHSSTITTNNSSSNASNANSQPQPPPPPKKKRSLPGNPDPSAEVIALSPNTLVTTNRFICEICNKGFQRDQNLQLHRRGHNLPWKLKQRSSSEVRKRVYVCPEASCVHHNPARALGDLTGIKKHFSRKHGDKKWKCEKCNKKYAVQSDWKAHSKICGTKEYKCDCGTVFSRRDSFITHRAFCDALADENNKVNNEGGVLGHFPKIGSNLLQPLIPNLVASLPITRNNTSISTSEFKQHPSSFPHELMPISMPEQKPFINTTTTNNNHLINPSSLPSLQLNSPHSPLNMFDESGGVHLAAGLPHMSATALLQKAAQMGATSVSNNNNNTSMAPPSFASSNNGIIMEHFMHNAHPQHDNISPSHQFNNNNNFNGSVGMNGVEMFNAILDQSKALAKIIDQNNRSSGFSIPPVSGRSSSTINIGGANKGSDDVMTLDFLGIGAGGAGGGGGGGDGGAHGYFGIGPLA